MLIATVTVNPHAQWNAAVINALGICAMIYQNICREASPFCMLEHCHGLVDPLDIFNIN